MLLVNLGVPMLQSLIGLVFCLFFVDILNAQQATSETSASGVKIEGSSPETTKTEVLPSGTPSFKPSRTLYFISQRSEQVFESGGRELFKDNTSRCTTCEIVVRFVGDEKGYIQPKKVLEALENLPESTKIVVFDFNFKTTQDMEKWKPLIEKLSKNEIFLFVQAGVPEPGERPRFLSQTFFGAMKDVFLFAELSIGERMWPDSHFGYEIFTAKRMPEAYQGQGLVALEFASKWLAKSHLRSYSEWREHLVKKRFNTKRLWVEAQELF